MGLSFAAPLALLGLLALPVIYWLLRVTPPAPREIVFPPVRLLRDLAPQERTRAKTPLPLLLLRLGLAGAAALAMAGPVWNWAAPLQASGPLLLVVDDGWTAAPEWDARIDSAQGLLDEASRANAPAALLFASQGAAAPVIGAEAREALRAARPKPWLPDRAAVASQVASFAKERSRARLVWVADGLDRGGAQSFANVLKEAKAQGAQVEILTTARATLALQAPKNDARALEATVLRAGESEGGVVEALDAKGRAIAHVRFAFAGADRSKARFELPVELRNEVSQLRIAGENSAGAVALLDARARVRRVAIVSGAGDPTQPLLSPRYYLEKALAPFTQLIKIDSGDTDPVLAALADRPNVLVLADASVAPGEAFDAVSRFVEDGGLLLRFAGSRLANEPDELLPVRLRRNTRVLGGAMSWETPKHLAAFEEQSPFFGLAAPAEITVSRQILAEPDPGLNDKTWARLADGTPLVTFEKRGQGSIVLFHVGADAVWSNLPISGLFVEMLQRVALLAGESAAEPGKTASETGALAPLRTLDGFGALEAPPAAAKPLAADFKGAPDAEHPPGYYGPAGAEIALQPVAADKELRALDFSKFGL
ncbi:MAG TPA: BatA domain-containing protein, partial [Methylocystis sp.]|nr:BatA domain-containing protein [Methylocystis sp.]